MDSIFKFEDIKELVEHYERRAAVAERAAAQASTKSVRALELREAYAWRSAASIIRDSNLYPLPI